MHGNQFGQSQGQSPKKRKLLEDNVKPSKPSIIKHPVVVKLKKVKDAPSLQLKAPANKMVPEQESTFKSGKLLDMENVNVLGPMLGFNQFDSTGEKQAKKRKFLEILTPRNCLTHFQRPRFPKMGRSQMKHSEPKQFPWMKFTINSDVSGRTSLW